MGQVGSHSCLLQFSHTFSSRSGINLFIASDTDHVLGIESLSAVVFRVVVSFRGIVYRFVVFDTTVDLLDFERLRTQLSDRTNVVFSERSRSDLASR